MQKFLVTIEFTANTIDTVSSCEIQQVIQDLLDDYEGGTAKVEICTEIP